MNTIKINKVDYPIVFGWNAIRKFSEETNINILSLEKGIVSQANYTLLAIYIGVTEGCRKDNKPFDLTIDEFVDLFDSDPDAIANAIKGMIKSLKMVSGKSTKKPVVSKNVKTPKS